jgi:hypothetical protein
MTSTPGKRRAFPKHRQIILDIVRESSRIPSFPVHRQMNLARLHSIRNETLPKLSWTTLFGKAYALVCQANPELREVFVRYPTQHLYRHPHSVASISIHRTDDNGNERLIWGRWKDAENTSLADLQNQLDTFCHAPMQEAYREGLMLERRNWVLRRLTWWWLMNLAGRKRAKHVGTFSISSLGGQGALNAHHPLITTTSLAIGPIAPDGECEVVLICDHRTLDGVLAAKALQSLEATLENQIADELQCNASSKQSRLAS